jgi:hypothetical protein
LTNDRTVRSWKLLACTHEVLIVGAFAVAITGVAFAPVLIRVALALLGVEGVVQGAIMLLWPDAAARFYRYIVSTRPPYRRPFFILVGPVDRSAMRGGAIGSLLLGVGVLIAALRT